MTCLCILAGTDHRETNPLPECTANELALLVRESAQLMAVAVPACRCPVATAACSCIRCSLPCTRLAATATAQASLFYRLGKKSKQLKLSPAAAQLFYTMAVGYTLCSMHVSHGIASSLDVADYSDDDDF